MTGVCPVIGMWPLVGVWPLVGMWPLVDSALHWQCSRTWIVSTFKGRQNRYSQSEVLTIQGAFNGIA